MSMESLEQNLITMLQKLPISITITWQSGLYHWHYDKEQGEAPDLVAAVEQALRSMMRSFPNEASGKSNVNGRRD
jgi:hypothetical protein